MDEKIQLKGYVYEVSFGFHSKLSGYTTLMQDMLELGVMHSVKLSDNI